MTDGENGDLRRVGDVVRELLARSDKPPENLLRDMEEQYPYLRSFLLGGVRNGSHWPAGTLKLARVHDRCLARMHVADLEVETCESDVSFFGLLEILENILQTDTGRWRLDWKAQEREKRRQLS